MPRVNGYENWELSPAWVWSVVRMHHMRRWLGWLPVTPGLEPQASNGMKLARCFLSLASILEYLCLHVLMSSPMFRLQRVMTLANK